MNTATDGEILDVLSKAWADDFFKKIWKFTNKIPGSFTELNAAVYYQYARKVGRGGMIVEIGVDQGRSASILAAVSERTKSVLMLIDAWESILIANKDKTEKMIKENFPAASFTIAHGRSEDIAKTFCFPIDLLHIDANHYEGGVDVDCEAWLPKLKQGGVAMFHDYGGTFPAVTEQVDYWTKEMGLEDLGVWDGLAVRRRR